MKSLLNSFLSLPKYLFRRDFNGIILMYHRIAEIRPDPWSLCVTPQYFDEHLQILKKFGQPLKLDEYQKKRIKGKLPSRWFAITFDDGYSDILSNAIPLLEKYDVSATLYITTNRIGNNREFWWDELEKFFLEPGELPEKLKLIIDDHLYDWDLGKSCSYSSENYACDACWTVDNRQDPTSRHLVYRDLHRLLMNLSEEQRQKVQNELLKWSNCSSEIRPEFRTLSYDEFQTLSKTDLIEIGSHTITHSNLAALSAASQQHEITQSKNFIEGLICQPVNSFSYPYGSFHPETISFVKQAGFTTGVTVAHGIVNNEVDSLRLPRLSVTNAGGELFNKFLDEALRT